MRSGNSLTTWLHRHPIIISVSLFLLVLTATIVLATVINLIRGQFDQAGTLAGVASAFATILLVVITATYAVSTHQLVRQNQIDRHRDTVVGIVGRGIDQIIDILDTDVERFEKNSAPTSEPPIPNLRPRSIHEKILQDITRENQSLGELYIEYRKVRNEYRTEWQDLKTEIEERLESDFSLSDGQMPVSSFLENLVPAEFSRSSLQFDQESMTLDELVQREATALTYYVLDNGHPPTIERGETVSGAGLSGFVFDEYRDEFLAVRRTEELGEDIDRLIEYRDEMAEVRGELQPVLDDEREHLMEMYNLLESEIPEPADPAK